MPPFCLGLGPVESEAARLVWMSQNQPRRKFFFNWRDRSWPGSRCPDLAARAAAAGQLRAAAIPERNTGLRVRRAVLPDRGSEARRRELLAAGRLVRVPFPKAQSLLGTEGPTLDLEGRTFEVGFGLNRQLNPGKSRRTKRSPSCLLLVKHHDWL